MTTRIKAAALSALIVSCSALSAGAVAQELKAAKEGTVVTLPVSASVIVDNDRARIQLYALGADKDLQKATDIAVSAAAKGIKALKADYPQAELKNVSLSSTPRYTKAKAGEASEISGWEVRQVVSAVFNDVDKAAAFTQLAAENFTIDSVTFELSDEAKAKVQSQLVKDVLLELKRQAQEAAKELGAKSYSIESVEFHNAGFERSVRYNGDAVALSATAARKVALPVFEPGNTTLQRSISAKVRLKGRK